MVVYEANFTVKISGILGYSDRTIRRGLGLYASEEKAKQYLKNALVEVLRDCDVHPGLINLREKKHGCDTEFWMELSDLEAQGWVLPQPVY